MDTMTRLNTVTHAVQHNPNCASPFLVRLVGPRFAAIDLKPYHETHDVLGFGPTLEAAAEAAFKKKDKLSEKRRGS